MQIVLKGILLRLYDNSKVLKYRRMKRIFVTFMLALLVSLSFAQTKNDNANRKYYCEIKCYEKGGKSSSKVVFEFGETVSKDVWECHNRKVVFVDEVGKTVKFKTMVDAANFLSLRGWELEQAYSSPSYSKKTIKHWVFSKEAGSYDDVKAGFITKKEYRQMKKDAKTAASGQADYQYAEE